MPGQASATVALCYDDAAIHIEIADNGRGAAGGPTGDGSGHGLIGMRERAASVGGTLQAGPREEGGYLVMALLPVEAPQGEAAGITRDGAADTADAAASGARS